MPSWSLANTHPTQGRTFQRPMGPLELAFFWEGLFNGNSDCLHRYEVSLSNSRDAHLFSEANITRAWLSTKRRYPLAGAAVRGAHGGLIRFRVSSTEPNADVGTGFESDPHFVVQEHDLAVLRSHEIVFGSVVSAEEARLQAVAIVHGPNPLSEDLLAKLYVLRETERGDVLHFMILLAHCVMDGVAHRTFTRCLLDTLARHGEAEPVQIPLEERLAMAIPSVDLEPERLRFLNPAIRRWRKAIGIIILQLRMARLQGGHTLPCRLTRSSSRVAPRPGDVLTTLTPTQTSAVAFNCRANNLAFGNAFPVLAQVAMTRLLYRRYLRKEISEEEWTYRKRQPYINKPPSNLRPQLNKAWLDKGGGGDFVACINLYFTQLPFMTLGTTAGRCQQVLSDGAPPFPDLLSFDRFLHRTASLKQQARSYSHHPLSFEIGNAVHLTFLETVRRRTLRWMMQRSKIDARGDSDEDEVLAVKDMPMVWAHDGSSFGDLSLITPSEYPLPPSHPLSPSSSESHPLRAGYYVAPPSPPSPSETTTPRIVVENMTMHVRAYPEKLFLGSYNLRGRMTMFVTFDANVYEEGVVREWLDEMRGAVLWYLGRTHCRSRRAPGRDRGDDGRAAKLGQSVPRAKL